MIPNGNAVARHCQIPETMPLNYISSSQGSSLFFERIGVFLQNLESFPVQFVAD